MKDQPVLSGFGLRLEPAAEHHGEGLAAHAEPVLFALSVKAIPPSYDGVGLAHHLAALRATGALPYVIVRDGEPVGVTTYLDIRPEHRGIEVGYTWIGRRHQGTMVNPATKRLMLGHAFDTLGYERVQLKCDGRNIQSQRAIEKLGGVKEGVLRRHMVLPDGFVRDTVMYSILAAEWPAVRDRLEARLAAAK
ncbi:MAG: GNAT family N-acetyltransferase [Fimbriimonas sp.]